MNGLGSLCHSFAFCSCCLLSYEVGLSGQGSEDISSI